jgi:hypothetical protein
LGVVQRFSQCGNVDAKAGLFDERVGPDMLDDLGVGLEFSGMRGEEDQDVRSPAAEWNGNNKD